MVVCIKSHFSVSSLLRSSSVFKRSSYFFLNVGGKTVFDFHPDKAFSSEELNKSNQPF